MATTDHLHRSARRPAAFSLIELLVCVAIVSILSAIGIVSYQGALDNADLKYAAPAVTGMLEGFRRESANSDMTITVEFVMGKAEWRVTKRKGADVETEEQDLRTESLIKRGLRFLRYEWPDGTDSPAQFTFAGGGTPQGGTVYFGTGKAETSIRVEGGRVSCELGAWSNYSAPWKRRAVSH